MKCPHCEYIDGWENMESIQGKEGEFYEFPIKMERKNGWDTEDTKVYACPDCKKVFINEY